MVQPTPGFVFIAVFLVIFSCLPACVSANDSSNGSRHDNSGRKIASVVPITASAGAAKDDIASSKLYVDVEGGVKTALAQGTVAARGLSKVALRKAGDLSTWISALWHEMNDLPLATPNTPVTMPEPPAHLMRPLIEPSQKNQQLWYTNEKRMKTVVNR